MIWLSGRQPIGTLSWWTSVGALVTFSPVISRHIQVTILAVQWSSMWCPRFGCQPVDQSIHSSGIRESVWNLWCQKTWEFSRWKSVNYLYFVANQRSLGHSRHSRVSQRTRPTRLCCAARLKSTGSTVLLVGDIFIRQIGAAGVWFHKTCVSWISNQNQNRVKQN